jgi:hypothetical protein
VLEGTLIKYLKGTKIAEASIKFEHLNPED